MPDAPRVARLTMRAALGLAVCALLAATGRTAGAQEWFEDYEAGVAALQRGEAARAIERLERAIRGRGEPGTHIITYGTNRIATYYPYLKVAEAHLLAGHTDAAREALRRSVERGKEPAEARAALTAKIEAVEHSRAAAAAAATQPHAPPPPTTPPPPTPTPTPTPTVAPTSVPSAVPTTAPPATTVATPAATPRPAAPVTVAPAPAPVVPPSASRPASPEATAAPQPAPSVPEPPSLVVFSDPPGATVYLDDELLGETDPQSGRLVKTGVRPGLRRLRLSRDDWADASREVTIAAEGPTEIRLSLKPAGPVPVLPPLVAALLVTAVVGLLLLGWQRLRGGRGGALPTPTISSGPTKARPSGSGTSLDPLTLGSADLVALGSRPVVAMPGVGERFGDYFLREQLGKGGMAAVYLAERGGELVRLEAAPRHAARGGRVPGALPPRGRHRPHPASPEHHPHLRAGRGEGRALLHHGARQGPDAAGPRARARGLLAPRGLRRRRPRSPRPSTTRTSRA